MNFFKIPVLLSIRQTRKSKREISKDIFLIFPLFVFFWIYSFQKFHSFSTLFLICNFEHRFIFYTSGKEKLKGLLILFHKRISLLVPLWWNLKYWFTFCSFRNTLWTTVDWRTFGVNQKFVSQFGAKWRKLDLKKKNLINCLCISFLFS